MRKLNTEVKTGDRFIYDNTLYTVGTYKNKMITISTMINKTSQISMFVSTRKLNQMINKATEIITG